MRLAFALLLLLPTTADARRRKKEAPPAAPPVEEVVGRPVGVTFAQLPCPLVEGATSSWDVRQGEVAWDLTIQVLRADEAIWELAVGPQPPDVEAPPLRWDRVANAPAGPYSGPEVAPILEASCLSLAVGTLPYQVAVATPFGPTATASGVMEVTRPGPDTVTMTRTETVDAAALAEAVAAAVADGRVSPEQAAGLHGAHMTTRRVVELDAEGRVRRAERVIVRTTPAGTQEEATTWTLR